MCSSLVTHFWYIAVSQTAVGKHVAVLGSSMGSAILYQPFFISGQTELVFIDIYCVYVRECTSLEQNINL